VAEDWKPDDDVIERTDTAMRKWRQGHVFARAHRVVSLRMSPSPARQPKSEERARESRSSAMTTWSWSLRPATLSRLVGTRSGGHPFVQVSPVVTLEGVSLVNASNGACRGTPIFLGWVQTVSPISAVYDR